MARLSRESVSSSDDEDRIGSEVLAGGHSGKRHVSSLTVEWDHIFRQQLPPHRFALDLYLSTLRPPYFYYVGCEMWIGLPHRQLKLAHECDSILPFEIWSQKRPNFLERAKAPIFTSIRIACTSLYQSRELKELSAATLRCAQPVAKIAQVMEKLMRLSRSQRIVQNQMNDQYGVLKSAACWSRRNFLEDSMRFYAHAPHRLQKILDVQSRRVIFQLFLDVSVFLRCI